jgi:ribose-phosphate pyrophosphokinase
MTKLTLNLVDPTKSDIKYQVSKFPDGQQSITLESNLDLIEDADITIKARLTNFLDLELIICANQDLLELDAKSVSLITPYYMGARSDRKFVTGSTNYLKTVICPIINSQNFKRVTVIDPHSDVLEGCVARYRKTNNFNLVKRALSSIDNTNDARERLVIVSPDGGALKKIYDVAEHFDIDKIVIAAKHRDIRSGKITHTEVPNLNQYRSDSNFVIIDDICDGGRTFIELAKVIKTHVWPNDEYFRGKIYLIVSHGIFSAGVDALDGWVDGIFTTNSVKDLPAHSTLTVYDAWQS